MLFFKKSEQEKKVGNFTIKGIQDILGFHCLELFWVKYMAKVSKTKEDWNT